MSLFIPLLAEGGLFYTYAQATWEARVILWCLGVASIFSWAVMSSKLLTLRRAKGQSAKFLELFRQHRQPLYLYETGLTYTGSPLYSVYRAGARELLYQRLGSYEIDGSYEARMARAPRISPSQMLVVRTVLERAVGEEALKLEDRMILLATAVSGAPFLGLLGTVWGVMDTFGGVARAGSANLAAMAPGVSAALITTVVGLLVAIPAMFGYNFLVTSIRAMTVRMDNFAAELSSEMEHHCVDHEEGKPAAAHSAAHSADTEPEFQKERHPRKEARSDRNAARPETRADGRGDFSDEEDYLLRGED